MPIVSKICGADVELGNFILGGDGPTSPSNAAAALLREIHGVPHRDPVQAACCAGAFGFGAEPGASIRVVDPQDEGRKFLATNGGCAYIDLNHLEICLPEVISAWDHLACWHAMLRMVRTAQHAADGRLPSGRIQVLVNNSDGLGASYGSHLNFLLARRAWDDMFNRKLHHLLFLASYQASSIVFTGQGKVGSENGAPAVSFQLSQRADFIETLVGSQTTFNRPLVNRRDEPLCGAVQSGGGARSDLARLHVICYDSNLSHVAHVLKIGVMQIVLSMIEAGQVNPSLVLDDPVAAMRHWSHDATLEHPERLVGGGHVTAVELQRLFIEEARTFVERGDCDRAVPRAADILALWDDTVTRLERGDFETLAGRLDWVLKLSMLHAVATERNVPWTSPEMKHLDHLFASLDADDGLFWTYEREGLVERLVTETEIQRFLTEPPADTRAWTRAMLLRGARRVIEVDWDLVRIRSVADGWAVTERFDLPDPRAFTRGTTDSVLAAADCGARLA